MSVFYAFIHNLQDDNNTRAVLTFANRSVADEWWRAVSTCNESRLRDNIKRISPQFYAHNAKVFNILDFFTNSSVSSIAEEFRGRMFITLLNDRGGRGLSIIPPQEITDHISGNWFCIRCRTDPMLYWYFDPETNGICASRTQRSAFRVTTLDQALEGKVMIGKDDITIHVAAATTTDLGSVGVDTSRKLLVNRFGNSFKFSSFEDGNFVLHGDSVVHSRHIRGGCWELVSGGCGQIERTVWEVDNTWTRRSAPPYPKSADD